MHGSGREIDLMPQTEVKCELLRYRPLVLDVSEQCLLSHGREGSRQIAPVFVRQIQQETGKSVGKARSRRRLTGNGVQGGRAGPEEESAAWTVCLSLQQVVFVRSSVNAPFECVISEDARPVANQVNVRFGANPRQTG